ncbi:flagellar biosynthesis protein FlhA [Candidatus Arthromitus sp. SFB-turkey]|uniref:flagellar biosynthesis protein FlhA n=1 Tax=Candidatus Arthromitus sp. SFB-turkey TaxID=1840217 RepID=UPI0007F3BBB3|nr:flagellar biosynthesis protein FlhA [Candidatus Arthromitus sp. SFB-turkey]OAT88967.1 EscV/YscV/HrcV family type III secretion system export apparatus protein [Candidatus Arthromitus sp. SFB-turkey]
MENAKALGGLKKKDIVDVAVAAGIIGIVLMIIIPMPSFFLDILIAVNITVSVVILLITIFATEVLQFSIFPSVLLVTTLFRLAINVSSTRLILSEADGGSIIEAFGNFVIGGNYVVGIIIFLIIVIIQFLVITNGAGRVSEVSARFTLDAMPGKQMSIDADLNSGIITEEEAKKRRKNLQLEADFYGSMDGASKFVKGDAIAGIIVTLINVIAGIVIGSMMLGMEIGEAASTYVRLTVGDGLVSQIPALLISTASGIIVTRSGEDTNLSRSLTNQFSAFPIVLLTASGILGILALIPGLPTLPFLILALLTGGGSIVLLKNDDTQSKDSQEELLQKEAEAEAELQREPENVNKLVLIEPIELEIGYGLIPLADEKNGGDLLNRIASIRRQTALELGLILKPIRIRDNLQLKSNEYVLKIRGTIVIKVEVIPNMLMAISTSNEGLDGIQGLTTKDPTFGLDAKWINKSQREEAELLGLTVVDPTTIIVTHVTETIKNKAYELLGRQETKEIIDTLKEKYPTVVEELVPDLMSVGEVQKVLQNLLKERIPIKDLVTIFESLADNSRLTKDVEVLTEHVRFALNRVISSMFIYEDKKIVVVTLSPKLEELLTKSIQKSTQGSFIALEPNLSRKVFEAISYTIKRVQFNYSQPVILVSPRIRPAFKKFTELVFGDLFVISLNEITPDIQIINDRMVEINDN